MTQRRRAPVAWTMRHGVVFGPVNAAAVVLAVTSVAQVAHVGPVRVGAVTILTTAAGILAAHLRRLPRTILAYWAACGLATATFLVWVTAAQPSIKDAGTAFAAGTLTASILYAALWRIYQPDAHDAPAVELRPVHARATLEGAIVRVLGEGVEVGRRQKGDYGYAIPVTLPDTGALEIRAVGGQLDRIAAAADLPDTISLTVEPAGSKRQLIIRATSAADLARELPLPVEDGPSTINRAFGIGRRLDGREARIKFLEISAMLIGPTRAGKTTALSVFIERLGACNDVVLWLIDLGKEAKIGARWNAPFLAGRTAWPVLDWTVRTNDDARTMLRAFLAEVKHRARTMQDVEKLRPSPEHPAIVLLIEEGPDAVSDPVLLDLIVRAARTGLEYGCAIVLLTQRPTLSMVGSHDITTQTGLVIGFAGKDLPQAFDFHPVVRADALPQPADDDGDDASEVKGAFYMRVQSGTPRIVKGYKRAWEDIPARAEALTPFRPRLDDAPAGASASALVKVYARRWQSEPLAAAYVQRWTPAEMATASAGGNGNGGGDLPERPPSTGDLGADLAAMGLGAASGPSRPAGDPGHRGTDLDLQFREVLADAGELPSVGAARIPEALGQVAAIFARPGAPERMHTQALLDALNVPGLTPRRLSDLLRLVGVTPLDQAFKGADGGKPLRGYERGTVVAAVANIREGRFTPPREAYEWPSGDAGEP